MKLIVLIGALAVFGLFARVLIFEFVLGLLLAAPVLWLLTFKILAASGITGSDPTPMQVMSGYLAILASVMALALVGFGSRTARDVKLADILPVAMLIVVFAFGLHYCHQWPDFFAMGERLRDYALLASNVSSPIVPLEPWMTPFRANYYVYWYRFGHMLSALLGFPLWEIYHVLVSFAVAAYAAVLFRIFSVVFRLSTALSAVIAFGIVFGSNVQGIWNWATKDHNWWGPSRVVQGAINEFPAWSFLLGDLHPHFANLCVLPFAILLFFHLFSSSMGGVAKFSLGFLLAMATHLFLLGSNAWEVPMWWAFLGSLTVCSWCLGYFGWSISRSGILQQWGLFKKELSSSPRLGINLVMLILVAIGAWLGGNHIVAEGATPRFVGAEIPVTRNIELFRHFGVPIVVLALGTMAAAPSWFAAMVFLALLGMAALYRDCAPILMLLAAYQLLDAWRERESAELGILFGRTMALLGLSLVLVPEFVFLDDPYGGENERMNTIFKIYTTSWFLLNAGAVFSAQIACRRIAFRWNNFSSPALKFACTSLVLAIVLVQLQFFLFTAELRKLKSPRLAPIERGLSEIEAQFPGSSGLITSLSTMPRGTTLEAQGNAYDYTSFVSTLSAQPSFLGWSNHVGLLTKQHGEVKRREDLTDSFYRSGSCSERRKMAEGEKITYVVVGSLEEKRYAGVQQSDFSCFEQVVTSGDYRLFRVGSKAPVEPSI
jgi:uncharacterized membrane protein